ncbi:MAG: GGDEF domain-containing protein [Actinomycetota bacterium]|nr:GGDEF domain-containing protein [Actinomycetota bacterium]
MTPPASLLGALRRLPRDPARFYAVSDLDTARRLGGVLFVFGALIVACLLPVSPPTDNTGASGGWLIGAGVVALALLAAAPLLLAPQRVAPNALLALAYASLGMIAGLQWAAGEHGPYVELFVISVLCVSAVHPPRRVLVFLVAVTACLALPFAYDGWSGDYAAQALAHILLWTTLSAAAIAFTAQVRVARMDLVEEEHEASTLARRDPLTGLGNRRAFDETLERVVSGARSIDRPLTLVIADIEDFKRVNDVHGHLAGDRCLREVAAAIARSVRPSDDVFRWGGDEFAVLLPATDRERALAVVDRIAAAVERDLALPGDEPLRLRYGVGEIVDGMDASALIAAADDELRAAKYAERQPAQ